MCHDASLPTSSDDKEMSTLAVGNNSENLPIRQEKEGSCPEGRRRDNGLNPRIGHRRHSKFVNFPLLSWVYNHSRSNVSSELIFTQANLAHGNIGFQPRNLDHVKVSTDSMPGSGKPFVML